MSRIQENIVLRSLRDLKGSPYKIGRYYKIRFIKSNGWCVLQRCDRYGSIYNQADALQSKLQHLRKVVELGVFEVIT